jgi:dihydropteroate synthase
MIVRVRAYSSLLEAQAEWRRFAVPPPVERAEDLWQSIFLYAEARSEKELEKVAFLTEELGGDVAACHSENLKRIMLVFESGLLRPSSCGVDEGTSYDLITQALANFHARKSFHVRLPGGELRSEGTLVMGVLNVTPDSFSDGGRYLKKEEAVKRAFQMAEEGADIIDVGGESTRPGSAETSQKEEKARVMPVLEDIIPSLDVPVSIDTRHHALAEAAANLGVSMINDVSGLRDARMVRVAIEHELPVVLMHMLGDPKTMQLSPDYQDVVGDILLFFQERIEVAKKGGLDERQIVLDPGIGFGKTVGHNLEILRRLPEYRSLGHPLLVGASRKSFIRKSLGEDEASLLQGSLAMAAAAAMNGASIIRAHDVQETKQVLRMIDAVQGV